MSERASGGRGGDTGAAPGGVPPSYGERRLRFGREAEAAAAAYLQARGWRLLGQNVRIGRGELDLIVRRGPVLAFVEVKARRSARCGAPEDAVSWHKRRQVARLAELWMAARPWALRGVGEVRFDIVAVDAAPLPPAVRHLPAAFTCDG
ncbi:MAG: YraN family protein [Thermoleophilia bacterium]|nr:YraN family protein [Thermoleophilia bacterium]